MKCSLGYAYSETTNMNQLISTEYNW